MTDESTKPKRKRRRWIIVGVLLFVVVVAGWWSWPRGDARFVGKWAYTSASFNGVMTLHANGSGRFELQSGFRTWFSWRVRDDRMISGRDLQVSRAVAVWIRRQVAKLTGYHVVIEEQVRAVIDVTDKRILLEYGGETVTLDRLPE